MQLIIAEKPSAADKIAHALGTPRKKANNGVYYWELPKKKIVVASAVGHLFELAHKKHSKEHPIFSVEWQPTYQVSKSAEFSKKYYDTLVQLAKKANDFVVATDYDIEGEVIGWNIVRYICGKKTAKRMKFSTLTKEDLQKAYFNMSKTLDWGQADAGETRHTLDYYYGINLSKAAMAAMSAATKKFQRLSIGRVQGPALSLLAERELEIRKFKPKTFWQIISNIKLLGGTYKALHEKKDFWKKVQASSVLKKSTGKAKVANIKVSKERVFPPVPFDLTSLQIESHRVFGFSPKRTLQIAQELYTRAYISYPRTSSQKLPAKLGFKRILNKLAKSTRYSNVAKQVLKTPLKPNEGKKIDAAHPAIYPTGDVPGRVAGDTGQLYDLIVKRFFAVFGMPGERESTRITFDINGENFHLHGNRTTRLGWEAFYAPYSNRKEEELPALKVGETYPQKTNMNENQTSPPRRFSESSLVHELEKENLGTKATRASIIDTLFKRSYVTGKSIEVSELGMTIYDVFSKYAPEIMSRELTKDFEAEMDQIRKKRSAKTKIINDAQKMVTNIVRKIDRHQMAIGKVLAAAVKKTMHEKYVLCKCPKCKKGEMKMIISRSTHKRFLACTSYPKCHNTWPLPQHGTLKFLDNNCDTCKTRRIAIFKRRSKPWFLCPNPYCKQNIELAKQRAEAMADKTRAATRRRPINRKPVKRAVRKG